MAYTKTTWAHDTKFTTTNLNNCETQYDEAYGAAVAHNHNDRYYTKTECDNWFWHAGNDGPGSTCDADLLYYAGGNKHYADFAAGGITTGVIIMWDNAVLPSGWTVCDGTAGTPDLRSKFVLGAGGTYAVGASGGSNTNAETYNLTIGAHTLTSAEMPSHRHGVPEYVPPTTGIGSGGDAPSTGGNLTYSSQTTSSTGGGGSHGHTGSTVTTTATDNKPPCVALYYIMKT